MELQTFIHFDGLSSSDCSRLLVEAYLLRYSWTGSLVVEATGVGSGFPEEIMFLARPMNVGSFCGMLSTLEVLLSLREGGRGGGDGTRSSSSLAENKFAALSLTLANANLAASIIYLI